MKTLLTILLCVSLASATTATESNERFTMTRHNNYVIAAFTDGWVCYGTYRPGTVHCHRAIPTQYVDVQ